MTRDEAIAKARIGRAATGFPHVVGMRSDGVWYCHALEGRRIADCDESRRRWELYEADELRQTRGEL